MRAPCSWASTPRSRTFPPGLAYFSTAARFSSPLGVEDFVKRTQYTRFTADALRAVSGDIALFARAEGLEAHARSPLAREGEEVAP